MPHRSFGAVRQGVDREPITFDFGLYGEETFTIIPDPTLGDVLELHDTPEPVPANEFEIVKVLSRFIRRMLPVEDRSRFDQALFRIPSTQSHIVIECAEWIVEQITPFVSGPPRTSSNGRPSTGTTSKRPTGGKGRSKR